MDKGRQEQGFPDPTSCSSAMGNLNAWVHVPVPALSPHGSSALRKSVDMVSSVHHFMLFILLGVPAVVKAKEEHRAFF